VEIRLMVRQIETCIREMPIFQKIESADAHPKHLHARAAPSDIARRVR
jgi:hypothetical protein